MTAAVMNVVRKLVALGVLLAILAIIVAGAVMPAWHRYDVANQSIATGRQLLARYVARPALGPEMPVEEISAATRGVYIPGETDALRIANLQETVADAAKLAGIRIASTRVIDTFNRDGVRMIGLQAQLSTELDNLQKLLFDLEKQRSLLFIDGLHIARGPDGGTVKLPALDVTFVVAGAAPEVKE